MFISLEGIEGVGKSTQLQFIAQYLREQGKQVTITHEPGGTPFANDIRRLLLSEQQETVHPDTELLLMFASRAQHIAECIKPALANGHWVLSDRFSDASYAYQGGGRGIDQQRIAELEHWVQGDLRPDLTILLDAPLDIALQRMQARGGLDRIESEAEDFFTRVRECYLARAKSEPERFWMIDASQSIAAIQKDIVSCLMKRKN